MSRIDRIIALCVLVLAVAAVPAAADPVAVTHSDLQVVDADGVPSSEHLGPAYQIVVEGIALNNPEDMLDPDSQWQVFVQGEGADLAGTAAWAGAAYQSSVWTSELARLNASGFREGDRVRVTGFVSAVAGKANVNERHSGAPAMDFTVELLEAGVGLPDPVEMTVADLNAFDATRATGGESVQCRRVRTNFVEVTAGTWGSNQTLTLADVDNASQTIPLRLCNVNFGDSAPNTFFHVVALGNQEGQFVAPGQFEGGLVDGYELWVTRADGIMIPGDNDLDGDIDATDLASLGMNWEPGGIGRGWADGDYDLDGDVDATDLALLGMNWSPGRMDPVPEPASAILLTVGAAALLRRRR
jgi:hypothetical protein